jgi:hypothetical protein
LQHGEAPYLWLWFVELQVLIANARDFHLASLKHVAFHIATRCKQRNWPASTVPESLGIEHYPSAVCIN